MMAFVSWLNKGVELFGATKFKVNHYIKLVFSKIKLLNKKI